MTRLRRPPGDQSDHPNYAKLPTNRFLFEVSCVCSHPMSFAGGAASSALGMLALCTCMMSACAREGSSDRGGGSADAAPTTTEGTLPASSGGPGSSKDAGGAKDASAFDAS